MTLTDILKRTIATLLRVGDYADADARRDAHRRVLELEELRLKAKKEQTDEA